MKTVNSLLSLLLLSISNSAFTTTPISICTDNNFWYPFTFVKGNTVTGLHIDIIRKALQNLGYQPVFKPMPWQECLSEAKEGKVDGVATASYKDERAAYFNYPVGAASDKKSPFRVSQIEYRVITSALDKEGKPSTYVFNGDIKELPQPVRGNMSYSLIADLKKEGISVVEEKHAPTNFKKLIKEHTGSIVDLNEVAQYYNLQPEFTGKIKVQPHPLISKSYYLVFSKRGTISLEQAQKIWDEIAKVREEPSIMTEFLKKY